MKVNLLQSLAKLISSNIWSALSTGSFLESLCCFIVCLWRSECVSMGCGDDKDWGKILEDAYHATCYRG